MKKLVLQIILSVLITVSAVGQANIYWSPSNETRSNIIADKSTSRASYPSVIKLFNLNFEPFKQQLFSIVDKNSSKTTAIISLPNATGNMEEFEVYEASNFEPA